MSLLKKWGLVEDVEEGPVMSAEEIARIRASMATPEVQVPADLNTAELVTIQEVYSKFNLTDTSKSIFKVDEFAKVLPESLPTDVKRQTVTGILAASGLQIDTLVADADSRINALQATLDTFTSQTNGMVADAEAQIADLESQIDGLKQLINDRKALQETEDKLIKEEAEKINKVVNFINPSK